MPDLNENHQRKLLTTCQYVDELLTEAIGHMTGPNSASPLQSYIADATPEQVGVLQQQLQELRLVMIGMLRENEIAIPSPQISGLWAFRTALIEAGEVVFDLQARFMSNYGPLAPEAQKRLDEIAARLMQRIEAFTQVFNSLTIQNPRAGQKEMEAS
ncbi:MAG: hypothetical protein ACYCUV_08030 [Phycisphaerae bacterium]|jgi:hypothetical protein